jgi:hypothetical protein
VLGLPDCRNHYFIPLKILLFIAGTSSQPITILWIDWPFQSSNSTYSWQTAWRSIIHLLDYSIGKPTLFFKGPRLCSVQPKLKAASTAFNCTEVVLLVHRSLNDHWSSCNLLTPVHWRRPRKKMVRLAMIVFRDYWWLFCCPNLWILSIDDTRTASAAAPAVAKHPLQSPGNQYDPCTSDPFQRTYSME